MAHRIENARSRVTELASAVAIAVTVTASLQAGDISRPAASESVRRVVVSIPDRKLALIEDGEVLKVYDVAVGARVSPSPVGQFKIINRIVKPSYHHTGKVVPPGKNNPLGTRWLGLSKPSYGIHGTNVPTSIGKAASHGCIRMRNSDVEELFELVRPGDAVEIVALRDESVSRMFSGAQHQPAIASSNLSPVVVAALVSEF